MAKSYYEKLKDPRWQKKRLKILERAGFKCEYCGASDKTLHVHHGYYEKWLDPWEYEDSTLWCLCVDCHEDVSITTSKIYSIIAIIRPSDLDSLLGFVEFFWDLFIKFHATYYPFGLAKLKDREDTEPPF